MKKTKLIIGLFALFAILDIFGIITGNELLRFISKPMIMLLLMTYYSIIVEPENKLYLAVLFFSFLGDVFLLFDSKINFMLGLASFLIAHILLILIVVRMLKKSSISKKIIAIVPFLSVFFGLIFLLKNNLEELLIPVVIYASIISTFGIVSLLNYLIEKSTSNLFLLVGAILFILSDGTLALNKFYQSESYFPVIIMVTYVLAQYFICRFMIYKAKKSAIELTKAL